MTHHWPSVNHPGQVQIDESVSLRPIVDVEVTMSCATATARLKYDVEQPDAFSIQGRREVCGPTRNQIHSVLDRPMAKNYYCTSDTPPSSQPFKETECFFLNFPIRVTDN